MLPENYPYKCYNWNTPTSHKLHSHTQHYTMYIQRYHLYDCVYSFKPCVAYLNLSKSLAPSSLLPCKYFLYSLFPIQDFTLVSHPFLGFSLPNVVHYTIHKRLFKELFHACHLVSLKTKSERYCLWFYLYVVLFPTPD